MLIANVSRSWPSVIARRLKPEESVLGQWASMNEAKLHQYADAILGVADSTVVAAYDIEGWERLDNGRVQFAGHPSARWEHLIGTASPVAWAQGAARPIRYLNTDEFADDSASKAANPRRDQLSVRGWTLNIGPHGDAVLHMPAGHSLTVVSTAPTSTGG